MSRSIDFSIKRLTDLNNQTRAYELGLVPDFDGRVSYFDPGKKNEAAMLLRHAAREIKAIIQHLMMITKDWRQTDREAILQRIKNVGVFVSHQLYLLNTVQQDANFLQQQAVVETPPKSKKSGYYGYRYCNTPYGPETQPSKFGMFGEVVCRTRGHRVLAIYLSKNEMAQAKHTSQLKP